MKLVLTAPDGSDALTVPADRDRATLKLTAQDGDVPGGVVFYDGDATITILRTEIAGGVHIVDLPFVGERALYKATVPGDDAAASGTVTAEPGDPERGGVAEVAIGQYDGWFALIAGVLVALAAGGIVGIAAWAIGHSGEGSGADRLRSVVTIGLFATGSLVVLLGAVMALLETRGRLRFRARPKPVGPPPPPMFSDREIEEIVASSEPQEAFLAMRSRKANAVAPKTSDKRRSIIAGDAEGLGKTLDSGSKAFSRTVGAASKARGTVLAFVIGLILLLVAFLGSSTIDFDLSVGGADPTQAPTETPDPEPSGG